MTSRIPPSRRAPGPDGLYALGRAAKVVQQQTPGAGRVVGVAKPGVSQAVAAAIRGKPVPQPVGGGVLGRAGVAASYPYGMSAGVNYTPSADLYQYRDEGDSGVTVSGTSMTIADGLYIVTCPAGFSALGAGVGLEVHTGYAFDSPGVGRSTAVAYRNNEAWCPGAGIFAGFSGFSYTPQVAFATSATGTLFAMFANEWDFEFVRLA